MPPSPTDPSGRYAVGASLIGLALGVSVVVFFSFSAFIAPLEAEFGWSRAQIAFALTLASLSTVLMSPVIGLLVDRFAIRSLLPPSILALALLLGLLAVQPGALWAFYALYAVIPVFGAATLPVAYSRVVIGWFDKGRGLALGVALSGAGVGAVVMPPLLTGLIDTVGWRGAYAGLAGLVLLVSLPVVLVFLRERSGAPTEDAAAPDRSALSGLLPSLRSRRFLLLAASFLLLGVSGFALLGHLLPILTSAGLSDSVAALAASSLGLAMIAGRVGAGYLLDRFHPPLVAFLLLLGPAIGTLLFALFDGVAMLTLAAIVTGLAMGAEFDILGLFVSRYFPKRDFGKLYGVLYGVFLIGGALGPLWLGARYDADGTYAYGLVAMCMIALTGAAAILPLGRFPEKEEI